MSDAVPAVHVRSAGSGKVCLVCASHTSSYSCPRCYIPYCSATCYAKHDVNCTEGFSRQRVKEVMDLEAAYGPDDPRPSSSGGGTTFGAYSDAMERELLTSSHLLHEETQGSEGEEEQGEEDDDDGSGEGDDNIHDDVHATTVEDLKRMPPHLLSRSVQLWTPWWQVDNGGRALPPAEAVGARSSIAAAVSRIKLTAPRLDTLVNTAKLGTDLIGYQVLGVVLGYVVAMRAVNGDWTDAPVDALEQLVQSTPAAGTDTTFKPTSVAQAVEAWLRYRPAPLQQVSRHAVRLVLQDALAVLRVWEFATFALLECWVLALVASDDAASAAADAAALLRAAAQACPLYEAADEVLSAMDAYSDVFRKPKAAARTASVELVQRKCFYVLLFALGDGSFGRLQSLAAELHEYITTYIV